MKRHRPWVLGLLLVVAAALGCRSQSQEPKPNPPSQPSQQTEPSHAPDERGKNIMSDAQRITVEHLALPDAEFFRMDDDAQSNLAQKINAALTPEGLPEPGAPPAAPRAFAIGAPKRVDTSKETELPVLIANRQTGQRQWEVRYAQNTHVVLVDLGTGATYTGRPLIKAKRQQTPPASMSTPPPNETQANTVLTGVRKHDAREVANLPWQPSRLAVTALSYDWVSNTLIVDLTGKPLPVTEPAPPKASTFLLETTRGASTPKLEGPGVAASIPPKATPNAPVLVHGALRIVLTADSVYPYDPTAKDEKRPTAVLPATLLLLKKDAPHPIKLDLRIPVVTPKPVKIGDTVEGFFSFDLRKALPAPLEEGTYQAYLFTREHVSGPHPIDFK